MMPLMYPLNTDVVPAPGITALERTEVTPYPVRIFDSARLVVLIPMVWSAALSMKQTLSPSAHDPGFLDAKLKFVAVE